MKYILLATVLSVLGFAGVTQAEQTVVQPTEAELKLSELASLPVGLSVVHTPDPVHSTFTGPSGSQFTHSTTVSSTVGPVTIVEFGCFYEEGAQLGFATTTGDPYTASNFAKWYGCPGAELQPDQSYTDESSRTLGSCAPEQVAKWYFIGLDAKGNRVKGEADVKLIYELDE